MAGTSDVCLVILAIFLPPVAVVLKRGCGADFLINILLTLCGHIPGVIHALYLILHDRERRKPTTTSSNQYASQTQQYPPQQQQVNNQAMYNPGLGNKRETVPEPMYGGQQQPQHQGYAQGPGQDQVQPLPPMYSDYTERDIAGQQPTTGAVRTGEKYEYGPPAGAPPREQGYGYKEV